MKPANSIVLRTVCETYIFDSTGYYGDGLNAIIVFAACFLPDNSQMDYTYVMENLFLWVWKYCSKTLSYGEIDYFH